MLAWPLSITSFLLVKCVQCSSKALGGFCLWTTSRFPNNSSLFPLSPSSSHSGSFLSASPSSWIRLIKWHSDTLVSSVFLTTVASSDFPLAFWGVIWTSSSSPIRSFRPQSHLGCPCGFQHHGLQCIYTKGLQYISLDRLKEEREWCQPERWLNGLCQTVEVRSENQPSEFSTVTLLRLFPNKANTQYIFLLFCRSLIFILFTVRYEYGVSIWIHSVHGKFCWICDSLHGYMIYMFSEYV